MKVQIPILNKATGRSGDTIFQSYYGNTYARSMPILFHYSDTPSQQLTQATFFDLQRLWIPIYNHLKLSIQGQQRKNKNPFNVMSSFIYKIFNPFNTEPTLKYPSNFGLDRLNRVRPVVVGSTINITSEYVELTYDMQRLWNGTSFVMTTTNLLLFNIKRQSMLYLDIPFRAGEDTLKMPNVNDWLPDDVILFYMALSCESWLGNFNRIASWNIKL